MEEILKSLPEPMQINSTTLIIAVLFLVLLIIMNAMVFKPLVAILEERQKRIEAGAEASKSAEKTVMESEASYQAAVIEARRKAQAKRQNVLKETEMACEETIASAKEQALGMVQAAATDLEQQVEQAKGSLKKDIEGIAQQIVSSVLSRASA